MIANVGIGWSLAVAFYYNTFTLVNFIFIGITVLAKIVRFVVALLICHFYSFFNLFRKDVFLIEP